MAIIIKCHICILRCKLRGTMGMDSFVVAKKRWYQLNNEDGFKSVLIVSTV